MKKLIKKLSTKRKQDKVNKHIELLEKINQSVSNI